MINKTVCRGEGAELSWGGAGGNDDIATSVAFSLRVNGCLHKKELSDYTVRRQKEFVRLHCQKESSGGGRNCRERGGDHSPVSRQRFLGMIKRVSI